MAIEEIFMLRTAFKKIWVRRNEIIIRLVCKLTFQNKRNINHAVFPFFSHFEKILQIFLFLVEIVKRNKHASASHTHFGVDCDDISIFTCSAYCHVLSKAMNKIFQKFLIFFTNWPLRNLDFYKYLVIFFKSI